jgi:hypothetical protein
MRAMVKPQMAPRIATGKAALYANDMSGVVWLAALSASSTKHRNATDRKKVITPEARPIPALKKNFFIKDPLLPINQVYVRMIT